MSNDKKPPVGQFTQKELKRAQKNSKNAKDIGRNVGNKDQPADQNFFNKSDIDKLVDNKIAEKQPEKTWVDKVKTKQQESQPPQTRHTPSASQIKAHNQLLEVRKMQEGKTNPSHNPKMAATKEGALSKNNVPDKASAPFKKSGAPSRAATLIQKPEIQKGAAKMAEKSKDVKPVVKSKASVKSPPARGK